MKVLRSRPLVGKKNGTSAAEMIALFGAPFSSSSPKLLINIIPLALYRDFEVIDPVSSTITYVSIGYGDIEDTFPENPKLDGKFYIR